MRTPWTWVAVALSCVAAPALSQDFGQFGPAPPLAPNTHAFGTYVTGGENALGLLAQLRLSFMPNVDFGFQGGLNRIDAADRDHNTVRMGADVKFGVAHASESFPVDVSMGGAIGVQTGDRLTILSLGPSAMASRGFAINPNNTITPYGGLLLRFTSKDLGSSTDTNFDLALRLGGDFHIGPDFGVLGEVQFNDDSGGSVGFSTGLNITF